MKIAGQLAHYSCRFQRTANKLAECHISIEKTIEQKILFGLLGKRKVLVQTVVWSSLGPSTPKSFGVVVKMHPDELRHWFQGVVREFEAYTIAWAREIEDATIVPDAVDQHFRRPHLTAVC